MLAASIRAHCHMKRCSLWQKAPPGQQDPTHCASYNISTAHITYFGSVHGRHSSEASRAGSAVPTQCDSSRIDRNLAAILTRQYSPRSLQCLFLCPGLRTGLLHLLQWCRPCHYQSFAMLNISNKLLVLHLLRQGFCTPHVAPMLAGFRPCGDVSATDRSIVD